MVTVGQVRPGAPTVTVVRLPVAGQLTPGAATVTVVVYVAVMPGAALTPAPAPAPAPAPTPELGKNGPRWGNPRGGPARAEVANKPSAAADSEKIAISTIEWWNLLLRRD